MGKEKKRKFNKQELDEKEVKKSKENKEMKKAKGEHSPQISVKLNGELYKVLKHYAHLADKTHRTILTEGLELWIKHYGPDLLKP